MKRLVIGIIALLAISACGSSENRIKRDSGVVIVDITHNGHEYVVFKAGYGATTLHSPNCPCQIKETK